MLEIERVSLRYGSHRAVDELSLTIGKGEVFALLGPNGAGKTTTLAAIEGLLRPASGTVRVLGFDPQRQPRLARASLGVHLQTTAFGPDLTLTELLRLFASLYGLRLSREGAVRKLREFGLQQSHSRGAQQLSGGQRQRLALLIATLHDPPLLLLDEPTTGLDPQGRRDLWQTIESLRAKGRSVLLTTHSMEEAAQLADRIAILVGGRLAALDTPQGLVARFRDDPRVRRAARGQPTLEDVFIGLTSKEEALRP